MPVFPLYPVADGSLTQWVVSPPGMPSYQAVMDLYGPDDLSTYIDSPAAGAIHLVKTESKPNVPVVRSVGFVAVFLRVRVGTHSTGAAFSSRIRSAGIDLNGPTVNPPADNTFHDYDGSQIVGWAAERDPATGQYWTLAAALAAEIGIVDQGEPVVLSLFCTSMKKMLGVDLAIGAGAVRGPAPPGWMP